MNNYNVAHKFAHGLSGTGSNFVSTGNMLCYYGTCIAFRHNNVVYLSTRYYSQYTSKVQGYARNALDSYVSINLLSCIEMDRIIGSYPNDEVVIKMLKWELKLGIEKIEEILNSIPSKKSNGMLKALREYNSLLGHISTINAKLGKLGNIQPLTYVYADSVENIIEIVEKREGKPLADLKKSYLAKKRLLLADENARKEKLREERKAYLLEQIQKFKSFEIDYFTDDTDGYCFLRWNKEKRVFETSKRITIIENEGLLFYQNFHNLKEGQEVLGWKVTSKLKNEIVISCHKFLTSEFENVLADWKLNK